MFSDVSEESTLSKFNVLLVSCSLLGVFFNPEDAGNIFLGNVGKLLSDHTASHPKK
jgi:hypothetical protein